MELSQFNIDPAVRRTLDEDTLRDVIADFSPAGECAVCGQLLGASGRFSLLVRDSDPILVVRAAHAPCLSSTRSEEDIALITESTYRVVPIAAETFPTTLLINPSVDQVSLMRDMTTDGAPYTHRPGRALDSAGWTNPRLSNVPAPVGTFSALDNTLVGQAETNYGRWSVQFPPNMVRFLQVHSVVVACIVIGFPIEAVVDDADPMAVLARLTDEDRLRIGALTLQR